MKKSILPALLFSSVLLWTPVQANQVLRETLGVIV